MSHSATDAADLSAVAALRTVGPWESVFHGPAREALEAVLPAIAAALVRREGARSRDPDTGGHPHPAGRRCSPCCMWSMPRGAPDRYALPIGFLRNGRSSPARGAARSRDRQPASRRRNGRAARRRLGPGLLRRAAGSHRRAAAVCGDQRRRGRHGIQRSRALRRERRRSPYCWGWNRATPRSGTAPTSS